MRKLELQTPLDELTAEELDKLERLYSEGVKRISFEKGKRYAKGPKAVWCEGSAMRKDDT